MDANWFVGLPVSAGRWFDDKVTVPPPRFRRFHSLDLHLTIAFLGPVGEAKARAGWEALVWTLPAIEVQLGSVVAMGDPRKYSALSALLTEGREAVESEMGARRGAVWEAAGARPETRPAKAHLTVARPERSATSKDREAGLRWAEGLVLTDVRVRLDSVALFTWSEDRSGRLFTIVEQKSTPTA